MAYTVKKVSEISGVSVRALHFYDEAGLLKPAYLGANGYRFYEEAQLLALQQILFYRELGFELKQIKKILNRPKFDKIVALESHRKILRKNIAHTRELLQTIEKTIEHLKGKKKMKTKEMFAGFDPETQAKHEQYLIDRYGEGTREELARSRSRVKNWTQAQWQRSGAVFTDICHELVTALGQKLTADSEQVQCIIKRHHTWLSQFWTPTAESYAGHSQLIVDSDLRKAYEAHDVQLPEFIAAAIRVYAEKELK
jgi:DNA-binding transcriptional MerR regulator